MTDAVLEEKLFPKAPKVSSTRQMPDFDYIRRKLLKNDVNKKLLWMEYMVSSIYMNNSIQIGVYIFSPRLYSIFVRHCIVESPVCHVEKKSCTKRIMFY